jgi:hypothetical protein
VNYHEHAKIKKSDSQRNRHSVSYRDLTAENGHEPECDD